MFEIIVFTLECVVRVGGYSDVYKAREAVKDLFKGEKLLWLTSGGSWYAVWAPNTFVSHPAHMITRVVVRPSGRAAYHPNQVPGIIVDK